MGVFGGGLFLLLFFGWLHAAELPNTGLAQNEYGYYGEGVTFGGYPIVGEWRLCDSFLSVFENNGTMKYRNTNRTYGVSEDGLHLIVDAGYGNDTYTTTHFGSDGCNGTDYYYQPEDFGGWGHSCIVCKTTHNNKSYGPNSNSVTITVGVD